MRRNVDLGKIKLVIWDLDDTLWDGTFAEGQVSVREPYFKLIKTLNSRGIVSSICSKNDEAPIMGFLSKIGAKDDFVFPSISYESKAPRIKGIVSGMNLREENCLFDDNFRNLEEALALMPKLMASTPEIADELIGKAEGMGKDDSSLSRLRQYKTLERKASERGKYYDERSFLASSNIRISFLELGTDELKSRAVELNARAHQLNYTKKELNSATLESLMSGGIECRLVQCEDKYGDYGCMGFYALDRGAKRLLHFCFSCRTLGMHVEQFVYEALGFPLIEVAEPVTIGLEKAGHIDYISIVEPHDEKRMGKRNSDILLIGPCDLETVDFFLPWDPVTEFRHFDEKGRLIAYGSHPLVLENALNGVKYSETDFFNPVVGSTTAFSGKYKLVIYSYITALLYGEYRSKRTGESILFGEWPFDATGEGYKPNENNIGFGIDESKLVAFREDYEYVGRASPEKQAERISRVVDKLLEGGALVCLLLGSEKKHEGEKQLSLADGEAYAKRINDALTSKYSSDGRVFFVNPTEFIQSQSDYSNSIQHYSRNVYKMMADSIAEHYPQFQENHVEKATPELLRKTSPVRRLIRKTKGMLKALKKRLR